MKSSRSKKPISYIASYKYELHPCHSFRIFAVTQTARSKLDKTVREMIVWHTTALDSIYNKVEDNDKLEDYLKAVPHLTICNEYRLHQELLGYKEKSEGLQEIRQQVSENSEQKIALFKDEIDKNLQLILAKVNMNNLSSR